MKSIFERVIEKGGYDLPAMLERIHEYHVAGRLTRQQRDELTDMARRNATAAAGMDIPGEIQMLWAAVRELQVEIADKNGEVEGGIDAADVPEFVAPTGAHDAYYNGSICRYNGQLYMCVAPDGVACVWSPDAMPGYWQVM